MAEVGRQPGQHGGDVGAVAVPADQRRHGKAVPQIVNAWPGRMVGAHADAVDGTSERETEMAVGDRGPGARYEQPITARFGMDGISGLHTSGDGVEGAGGHGHLA